MAEGHTIGVTYGGTWRSLGNYLGGQTLTTNFTIAKWTAGGVSFVLCSAQGGAGLTYNKSGVYLINHPYNDTSIGVTHMHGTNSWTFAVSSNLLTVTGSATNWSNWICVLSNKT